MKDELSQRLKNFIAEYTETCKKYRCMLNTDESGTVTVVPLEEYGLYGNSELQTQLSNLENNIPD